ncbi:MAG: hypothetical protein HY908_27275 [Myxococcales bacterium]|nr:hypothetical protein [Myxococcales bacterium]
MNAPEVRALVVAMLPTLASLCACGPALPASAPPATTMSPAPAAGARELPRVVHQLPPSFFLDARQSPDGSLLAIVAEGLTLVDTASGSVRARFPWCASDAVFRSDAARVFVAGCTRPGSRPNSVRTALYSWDLTTDRVETLNDAIFAPSALELVAGETEIALLRGQTVETVRVADGSSAFFVDGEESLWRADSMIASSGRVALLPAAGGVVAKDELNEPIWQGGSLRYGIGGPHMPAALAPDGQRALAAVGQGELALVRLSDRTTELTRPFGADCSVLGFSPDSSSFAVGCLSEGAVQVLDLGGRERCRLPFPPVDPERQGLGVELSMSWATDGTHVAVERSGGGPRSGYVGVWRLAGCERTFETASIARYGGSSAWSGNLDLFAYRAYEVQQGGGAATPNVALLHIPSGAVRAVPTRDSARFIYRGDDGLVLYERLGSPYLFDPASGRRGPGPALRTTAGQLELHTASGAEPAYALVPAEGTLAIARPDGGRIELEGADAFAATRGQKTLAVSPGGGYVSAISAQLVMLWDARTGRKIAEAAARLHAFPLRGFAFDSAGTRAAVLADDGVSEQFLLFDLTTGQRLAALTTDDDLGTEWEHGYRWSRSGKELAVDGVGLVDAASGEVRWKATYFAGAPFAQDGTYVITGEGDPGNGIFEAVAVRDATTGRELRRLPGAHQIVSAGGSFVVALTLARTHRLYSLHDWVLWGEYEVDDAQLSPDGRFLYLFSSTRGLEIERTADGVRLGVSVPRSADEGAVWFTDRLFDGDPKGLDTLRFRFGDDVRNARLGTAADAQASRRPGLAAAFFGGERLERGGPAAGPP